MWQAQHFNFFHNARLGKEMITSISSLGLNLIKSFEELRLEAYLDQGGVPTIGWGTTKLNGYPVAMGMIINRPVAEALLYGDVLAVDRSLGQWIKFATLNQNQFDALTSLVYNIGIGNFVVSKLMKALNASNSIRSEFFTDWCKVTIGNKKVLSNGLLARRKKEFDYFVMV